jgi:hypothetical protein
MPQNSCAKKDREVYPFFPVLATPTTSRVVEFSKAEFLERAKAEREPVIPGDGW